MPVTISAVKPGFWIAMADLAGAKTSLETQLTPAPTRVEYPNAELGEMIETADGRVVMQVSTRDPRRRSWVWSNYGANIAAYERQYRWLHQLTSRVRLGLGLSPYVYVLDGTTNLLNRRRTHTTLATVSGTNSRVYTLTTPLSGVATSFLTNATVDVLPAASGGSTAPFERRSVLSATAAEITLDSALSAALASSQLLLSWSEPVWWKARVLDTTRDLRDEGGPPRYTSSRFTFVIDEEMSV